MAKDGDSGRRCKRTCTTYCKTCHEGRCSQHAGDSDVCLLMHDFCRKCMSERPIRGSYEHALAWRPPGAVPTPAAVLAEERNAELAREAEELAREAAAEAAAELAKVPNTEPRGTCDEPDIGRGSCDDDSGGSQGGGDDDCGGSGASSDSCHV